MGKINRGSQREVMKVLIIKLSSIGDVVQTLPALRALREGLERRAPSGGPKPEIDWLVEEPSSSVLRGNPLIDNLIVVSKGGWTRESRANIRTAKWLAARQYDLVMDFQGLFKSALWAVAVRGKRVIGFANSRELSHLALSEKAPAYDPDRHAVLRYLDLVQAALGEGRGGAAAGAADADAGPNLESEADDVEFPLYVSPEALDQARGALRRAGVITGAEDAESLESPFFIMVPRSRWRKKLWVDDKFVELGRILTRRYGLRAVIVGSDADRAAAGRIKRSIGRAAHNLAGRVDLTGLAALMRLARFCVTLDSGPMHIAVAAGVPVVALFGPTAPWRTGPLGKGHRVVRKDLPCSPCFRKKCRNPRCMTEIEVTEVLGAVERLGVLARSGARGGQKKTMGSGGKG